MAKNKKDKADKNKKDAGPPKQEIDAVKGFIAVMVLLIIALGVFIVITMNQLEVYEKKIAVAKAEAKKLGNTALEVQAYLKLIKDSGETVLMKFPERFFSRIYQSGDIGIAPSQVTVGPKRDSLNRREKYTEISWDLDINDINRRQASLFLHGVENDSMKAKALEISMRRSRKKEAAEDSWDGRFKVGYRIAAGAK